MNRKFLYVSCLMFLLSFAFVNSSKSVEYLVGVEELSYFPHYSSDNGNYGGFARDLLDAFAKYKGISFKYEIRPLKRLFGDFLDEQLDFKYPDNPYWQADLKKEKNKKVIYSDPIVDYIDGVVVLPENKGAGIKKLKLLGIVGGFTAWNYLAQIKSGEVKVEDSVTSDALLKKVIAKRNDGAYANVAVAKYQLEKVLNQPNALVFDPDLPHTKSSYLLSTIKHPGLMEDFNKFLKEKKDLVDEIKKKYQVQQAE
ncbi:MAG: transporter substrate-binding domain-containing protein [Oligoflexia bacterium]|nr:transporter substrate-binding domain-containing protein [Oligoflexia bacterium]